MEFKGTKGEWKAEKIDGYDYDIVCDGQEICWTGWSDIEGVELQNNAKLIAAAPELLRELIDTYNCCMENFETAKGIDKDVYKEIADGARKAINKALK